MSYDVVIVGGGPAGLAAAIRIKAKAAEKDRDISVCLIDKAPEIGAHTLSGAVMDPAALTELLPEMADTLPGTKVTRDDFAFLTKRSSFTLPASLMPPLMSNKGMRIISLGRLCRTLAEKAEAMGVEIYPGFSAVDVETDESGAVTGIITGDMGRAKDGSEKAEFTPGMVLKAKHTLLAEGTRGSLSEAIIRRFDLRKDCGPQKYGLGIKELWRLPAEKHRPGYMLHTMGWPLDNATGGGMFLYHWGEGLCSVGLVVHLNYKNPYFSPFETFQRAKQHPLIRTSLEGAERIGYGARTVSEGGWQSVPHLTFPGGALIGDGAGFLNLPRIKGIHNAIRSGMMAADSICDTGALTDYEGGWKAGTIGRDLWPVRNVKPLLTSLGTMAGMALAGFDMWCQTMTRRSLLGTLKHHKTDAASTYPASLWSKPETPQYDGKISFDLSSSLYLANLSHEENQPVHLKLTDPDIPVRDNLPVFDEPAQHVCPAGVYEILSGKNGPRLQINAANCLHCKACEIKDPAQNIIWTPPEGGSGPIYSDM